MRVRVFVCNMGGGGVGHTCWLCPGEVAGAHPSTKAQMHLLSFGTESLRAEGDGANQACSHQNCVWGGQLLVP